VAFRRVAQNDLLLVVCQFGRFDRKEMALDASTLGRRVDSKASLGTMTVKQYYLLPQGIEFWSFSNAALPVPKRISVEFH
jgi:hypothetical protein